ncbi:MAG: hypothetical protein V7K76_05600 [Nostoc sp.]
MPNAQSPIAIANRQSQSPIPNPQSPILNPQSPIPNPQSPIPNALFPNKLFEAIKLCILN